MKMFNSCIFAMLFCSMAIAQNTTAISSTTPTNNATTMVPGPLSHDGVYIGLPTYSGSGCPSGTVSGSLSPDERALSVLFDDYTVNAGGSFPNTNRLHCDIVFPIDVPPGYQVSIVRADYRGFNDLPIGAQSQFKVEYFLAGETTNYYTQVYDGEITDNFLLQDTVNTDEVQWSRCGHSANFRINTDISVFSNGAGQAASTSLDTADISVNDPGGPVGLQFYFVWTPCAHSSASTAKPLGALMMTGALVLGGYLASH